MMSTAQMANPPCDGSNGWDCYIAAVPASFRQKQLPTCDKFITHDCQPVCSSTLTRGCTEARTPHQPDPDRYEGSQTHK